MNRLIENRKDVQVADLTCGYSSRGIRLSRQGRTYYGLDLPAVTDAIGPAVESMIGKKDGIRYQRVDATNYASLEAAFSSSAHDLMFTTEGLLMYFSQSELNEVFSNIRRLLQKYGGSWIITDRAYFLHDQEIVEAALNDDRMLVGLYAAITGRAAGTTADVKFNDIIFFDPDDEKVKAYIKSQGFELKEICMGDYLPEQLGSMAGLPDSEAAVRKIFRNLFFWELSVAGNAAAPAAPVEMNLPFRVESSLKDGVFSVAVQGRMDTMTAPELLRQFQEAGAGIEAIH